MSLRLAIKRLAPTPKRLAPITIEGAQGSGGTPAAPGTFFEEKYFWSKANVGPFFLLLAFTPFIYRKAKDAYWTVTMRSLNNQELINDRYDWLRTNMIADEVEKELVKQVPAGGFKPLMLGPDSPQ